MTRIVMTGGGSGGHITPIFAVAHQVKQMDPAAEIIYVGQTGDSLGDIPSKEPSIDKVYTVRAGKLRRYHDEGLRQLLDLPTVAKNLRDVVYVAVGLWQSYWLLRRLKPDVVFVKGGFVGVPVGLAAAALNIPFVTHDSDAVPGLANRIISRWARLHTVALPKEVYQYPADKTLTVGVPVSHEYRPRNDAELAGLRAGLGLADGAPVVLVTGGGLGALRLNNAVLAMAARLLEAYPDLVVVHVAGRLHEEDLRNKYNEILPDGASARVKVLGFVPNLYAYAAAASVVVTRAGGNSMAEYAALGKACVVVPNPGLAGGHQTKNAQVLADNSAVVLVTEPEIASQPMALLEPVCRLLDNPQAAAKMGAALRTIARPDAAKQLAVVLLDIATNTNKQTAHDIQPKKTDS